MFIPHKGIQDHLSEAANALYDQSNPFRLVLLHDPGQSISPESGLPYRNVAPLSSKLSSFFYSTRCLEEVFSETGGFRCKVFAQEVVR